MTVRGRTMLATIACAVACAPALSAQMYPAASGTTPMFAARVDSIFAPFASTASPGCAVGVLRSGQLVFAKGYGMADLEHGIPITSSSRFIVGSVAKHFTAFAVHLLASRGALALDHDIRRYLPEFPDLGVVITIRHLLHHTSGVRAYEDLLMLSGWNRDHPLSRDQFLELMARQRALSFAPGDRFMYGNSNYALLSMIVERVANRPFSEWMAAELFTPLGMTHTFVRDDPMAIIPGRAEHYWPADSGFRRNVIWAFAYAAGSSNVVTTLGDLARWDQNFTTGRVGEAGLAARMTERFRLNTGDSIGGAVGVATHRGIPVVSYTGGGGGDYAYVRFPTLGFSTAVLCNLDRGGANAWTRAVRVAEAFLPQGFPADAAGTVARRAALTPAQLARFAGSYRDRTDPMMLLHFTVDGGVLRARREGDTEAYDATPVSDTSFQVMSTTVAFTSPRSGGSRQVTLVHPGGTMQLSETGPAWMATAEELDKLVGTYRSDELDVTWHIQRGDSGIVVVRPRFPVRPLVPLTLDVLLLRDIFEDEVLPSHLTFQRATGGRVSAFLLDGDRVGKLEFRRVVPR